MEEKITVKEFEENLKQAKYVFSKEINELKEMIKEELGENKNYFRISLVTELIERDLMATIDIFGQLIETMTNLENIRKEFDDMKNMLNKKIDVSILEEDIDPVSRIVKDVNTLDEVDKRKIMAYVAGFAYGAKDKKVIKK